MSDSITIDLNDLKDGSHLKALLESQQKAALSIASELARYAGQPIQAAVGSNPAKISISAPTNWKTSTGIGFSLTPTATCSVSIAKNSTKFAVAKSIDSTETNDIVSGPSDGKIYVNIDLDFSIAGSVSGSGDVSGIGISGKGTGSASTTLSYCHAVDATTETLVALKDAFSNLVFPFEPNCALKMGAGDVGRVNFDGSLGFDLAVSYGLASYKFSAPGVDSVQTSMQRGVEKLTIPTVDVEAGAKASFSYTHSDHFGAIIQKVDAQNANMYLVRSAASEFGVSVGVNVGISVTPKTASVDKQLPSRRMLREESRRRLKAARQRRWAEYRVARETSSGKPMRRQRRRIVGHPSIARVRPAGRRRLQ
jgi:hypothetical protein